MRHIFQRYIYQKQVYCWAPTAFCCSKRACSMFSSDPIALKAMRKNSWIVNNFRIFRRKASVLNQVGIKLPSSMQSKSPQGHYIAIQCIIYAFYVENHSLSTKHYGSIWITPLRFNHFMSVHSKESSKLQFINDSCIRIFNSEVI